MRPLEALTRPLLLGGCASQTRRAPLPGREKKVDAPFRSIIFFSLHGQRSLLNLMSMESKLAWTLQAGDAPQSLLFGAEEDLEPVGEGIGVLSSLLGREMSENMLPGESAAELSQPQG